MSAVLSPGSPVAPAAAPAPSTLPWLGLSAVLFGAIVTTLTSRLTSLGLADVRGAVGASVDEGAWISTAFTVAQMLIGPVAVWLGFVFGTRRVLVAGAIVFLVAEALLPLSPNLAMVLTMQALAGLGSGTFIPVTIGFLLVSLPPRWWSVGIAIYAMNLELSLNIAATLEGWYIEHASWHWIYWQNALMAIPMLVCLIVGLPSTPIDWSKVKRGDFVGMACAPIGFSLVYAALDQGDRLDWFASPMIAGLAIAGTLLIAAFFFYEARTRNPGIDVSLLGRRNMVTLLVLVVLFRFLITCSGYLVPQFLAVVKGFRSDEIGDVLLWIALPQLIVGPLIGLALLKIEPRRAMVFGCVLMLLAFVHARTITSAWAASEFIPSQLMQAVGQTVALTALIFFVTQHLKPTDALTFGAFTQTARLFGGELGIAAIQVFTRKSEQTVSSRLNDHLGAADPAVLDRLGAYAAGLQSAAQGDGVASAQAIALLDRSVRAQSFTLAIADGMALCVAGAVVALVLVLSLRRPPALP